jgi:hypothetical protein
VRKEQYAHEGLYGRKLKDVIEMENRKYFMTPETLKP